MDYDADAIVIGAGGGGAVAAKELGEKGLNVILLEAGPWYGNSKWPNPNAQSGAESSSDFEDLNIEILRNNFTDLEQDMNDSITGKFRWGPADRGRAPWPRNIAAGGSSWQNSGVGGSTLHYWANSPRAFPQAVDNVWPISYSELIPYYEKVEATLPVETAPATPKEDIFFYGLKQAGWKPLDSKEVITPGYRLQPNAILKVNLGEDAQSARLGGCTLRGHCMNGCRIGPTVDRVAKRTTLVSYIPLALKTGKVEVRPNAFVTKVLVDENTEEGIHATGVLYRNTWSGETIELRAKVIVMSAGGIESPRLWLNSELPQNEWVGKGLVNHWFDSVSAIFEEKVLMDVLGVDKIEPFVGQNAAARFDHPGLGVIETYGISPGLYASFAYGNSYKGYSFMQQPNPQAPWDVEGMVVGEQLKEFMMDYTRTVSVLIFTDDDVNQNNTVTVSPTLKDENGFVPVISYTPSEIDRRKREKLAVIASDIFRKAGAKTVIRANWSPNVYIHITSTMRMGYVTDSNCEAKQVKRLYIADNSVLYNGIGGPNPTLTTQALATRTSEKIKEKYFNNN